MSTELTVFSEFETGLALLETSNAEMKFDDTPEGLAERRAWYRKLRKGTRALDGIRKDAGAEYLRLGREVNAEAKTIQARLDKMELTHKIILDAEDAKVQAEIDAKAAEAEALAEAVEVKRLADLEEREAKAQAIIDAAEQVERDAKAAQEAEEAAKLAEVNRLAAIEEGKRQYAAQAHKDKNDRIAAELKAKIAEDARIADTEHRNKIEFLIVDNLKVLIALNPELEPVDLAQEIVDAIATGKILNIQINYY